MMVSVLLFVSCFTYVDLLGFLLLPHPPFGFPCLSEFLIESYGVNVGIYIVAAAHFHTCNDVY